MDILGRFSLETSQIQSLQNALQVLSTKTAALATLTINQCNANYGTFGKPGKPFSQADIDFKENSEKLFSFKTIFSRGFKMLKSYLDNPNSAPSDTNMKEVLARLLAYLLDKDNLEAMMSVNKEGGRMCKGDLTVVLAHHYLAKLTLANMYTLDNNKSYKRCSCGCMTDVRNYNGDTSLGNIRIWHGNSDILLGNNLLPIVVLGQEEPRSPNIKFSKESEVPVVDELEDIDLTSEILAKNIVFSFAQRKFHPDNSNFLVPTIGVDKDNIIYYFYDSEHDILMKSPSFTLFDEQDQLRIFSILTTWFVVNYKFLCSGLTKKMIQEAKCSNFFAVAGDQLSVYREAIQVGGIESAGPVVQPYQPWIMVNSEFIDDDDDDEDSSYESDKDDN